MVGLSCRDVKESLYTTARPPPALDPAGLEEQVKEHLGGHNSISDINSSVRCHVSEIQKTSKLLVMKKSFRINVLLLMERAFTRAIRTVFGAGGEGRG